MDKKAYLSALAISEYIVVTCDSSSMISEAATENVKKIFINLKSLVENNNFQLVVIPSMRTPKNIINYAKEFL